MACTQEKIAYVLRRKKKQQKGLKKGKKWRAQLQR